MRLNIKKTVVKQLQMTAFSSTLTQRVNGGAKVVLWSENPTCGVICVAEPPSLPTCGIGCVGNDKM